MELLKILVILFIFIYFSWFTLFNISLIFGTYIFYSYNKPYLLNNQTPINIFIYSLISFCELSIIYINWGILNLRCYYLPNLFITFLEKINNYYVKLKNRLYTYIFNLLIKYSLKLMMPVEPINTKPSSKQLREDFLNSLTK